MVNLSYRSPATVTVEQPEQLVALTLTDHQGSRCSTRELPPVVSAFPQQEHHFARSQVHGWLAQQLWQEPPLPLQQC